MKMKNNMKKFENYAQKKSRLQICKKEIKKNNKK